MEDKPDRRAGTALKTEGAHSPWAWASIALSSARSKQQNLYRFADFGGVAELVRPLLGKQRERETVIPVRIRSPPPDFGCLAQLVEQGVDNAQVIGSIPMTSTRIDSLAQLVERWSPKPQVGGSIPSRVAKRWKVAGVVNRRAFEMRWLRKQHEGSNPSPSARFLAVAQLVSQ